MTDGGYTLGIDLGTTFSAAAVDVGGRTQVVTLGHRSTVVPSVAYVAPDGTTVAAPPPCARGGRPRTPRPPHEAAGRRQRAAHPRAAWP